MNHKENVLVLYPQLHRLDLSTFTLADKLMQRHRKTAVMQMDGNVISPVMLRNAFL